MGTDPGFFPVFVLVARRPVLGRIQLCKCGHSEMSHAAPFGHREPECGIGFCECTAYTPSGDSLVVSCDPNHQIRVRVTACVSCGADSTHRCTHGSSLICGAPLCDDCRGYGGLWNSPPAEQEHTHGLNADPEAYQKPGPTLYLKCYNCGRPIDPPQTKGHDFCSSRCWAEAHNEDPNQVEED